MKKALSVLFIAVLMLTVVACSAQVEPELTADEALDIALEEGVTQDGIRNVRNRLDLEDGIWVYEIDFAAGDIEYSYDVNAQTGSIVESDRERAD